MRCNNLMPLPYYDKLSRRDQAIYRASDKVTRLAVDDPGPLAGIAAALERALESDDRLHVERLAQSLADGLADRLRVSRPRVRVLSVRPRESWGELHGLYERTSGERAVISVWMRTARNKQVVRFRTFLRTLCHELCHHLDYEHLQLADSFHTEGFFKRESALLRHLVPGGKPARAGQADTSPALPRRSAGSDASAAEALARCRELLER